MTSSDDDHETREEYLEREEKHRREAERGKEYIEALCAVLNREFDRHAEAPDECVQKGQPDTVICCPCCAEGIDVSHELGLALETTIDERDKALKRVEALEGELQEVRARIAKALNLAQGRWSEWGDRALEVVSILDPE